MIDFEVHLGNPIFPLQSPGMQTLFSPNSPLKFNEVYDTDEDDFKNTKNGYMEVLREAEHRQTEAQASASAAEVIKRKEEDFNYNGVILDDYEM